MESNITREQAHGKSLVSRSGGWLLCLLAACLFAGLANEAVGQKCQNCVYFWGEASNDTGTTPATSLTVPFTIPSTTACPNAMLIGLASIAGAAGPPHVQAPALATTTGIRWNNGATNQNLLADTQSDIYSEVQDTRRLHGEFWYVPSPNVGTGQLTFTIGSGSAIMVARAILLCGVSTAVNRVTTNNTTVQNQPLMGLPSANGRMWIDNCTVDGDVTATAYSALQVSNVPRATGSTVDQVASYSSLVAETSGGFPGYGYNLSYNTFYACDAVTFDPAGTTSVGLEKFTAKTSGAGVALRWWAGQEADNLGFRLFREENGSRVQITPELIAGSALSYPGSPLQAGYSYGWRDPEGRAGSEYWLEDFELGGRTTLRGPFVAEAVASGERVIEPVLATPVSRVGQVASLLATQAAGAASPVPFLDRQLPEANASGLLQQLQLAGGEAAKIVVKQEGWYRVTGADLVAAGLNFVGSDPRYFQLFVNGSEQAINVNAANAKSFGVADSIEFYGVPLDTQWAGTQTYWLTRNGDRGERISADAQSAKGGKLFTTSFTAEFKDRLFYAGGILNGDKENLFGRVVTSSPATISAPLPGFDKSSKLVSRLEVALQGFSDGVTHVVQVNVNGTALGTVKFTGKKWQNGFFNVPASALVDGSNAVTLQEVGDPTAVGAVDYVRVTYPRVSKAVNDVLYFSASAQDVSGILRIGGFSNAHVRVFDVTDPGQVSDLGGTVSAPSSTSAADGYSIDFDPGFSHGGWRSTAQHFLAIADKGLLRPVSIVANKPSSLWRWDNRADYLVISHASFIPALADLKSLRESQGMKVMVVDVEDVYDEFGYGVKSPQAIQALIRTAASTWAVKPRFVVLVGDGSQDPRNYLGLGQDFVPTKLVDTKTFESASDDWMADVNGDGKPEVALGRLPARTLADATAMVKKIVLHDKKTTSLSKVLFVADTAVLTNFQEQNKAFAALLPSTVTKTLANADEIGDAATHTAIVNGVVNGVDLVHYSGHGTIDHWRGTLLSEGDVPTLANLSRLPIFTVSNCLTGIFQEPLLDGLGEVLVKTPDAGAVAVWASSGTTEVPGQKALMTAFFQALSGNGAVSTLGEAVRKAKASATDPDVRSTWILLGDPATRIR